MTYCRHPATLLLLSCYGVLDAHHASRTWIHLHRLRDGTTPDVTTYVPVAAGLLFSAIDIHYGSCLALLLQYDSLAALACWCTQLRLFAPRTCYKYQRSVPTAFSTIDYIRSPYGSYFCLLSGFCRHLISFYDDCAALLSPCRSSWYHLRRDCYERLPYRLYDTTYSPTTILFCSTPHRSPLGYYDTLIYPPDSRTGCCRAYLVRFQPSFCIPAHSTTASMVHHWANMYVTDTTAANAVP